MYMRGCVRICVCVLMCSDAYECLCLCQWDAAFMFVPQKCTMIKSCAI